MYKVGDKVVLEIESITNEQIGRYCITDTIPVTLYKLKGIPVYLSEDDFMNAISVPKEEEMQPCTCGGTAKLIAENYGNGYIYYAVCCTKCHKFQTLIDDKEKAIEAWNRRANDG